MIGSRAKRSGLISEVFFELRALEENFVVSRPSGDNAKYDLITDWYGAISRIQVKASHPNPDADGGYAVAVSHGSKSKSIYHPVDVDFVAISIYDMKMFYIIPIDYVRSKTIKLNPIHNTTKYEQFRENWNLLRERKYHV